MTRRHNVDVEYVIERRTPDGVLDLRGVQPERFFGDDAITGITEYQMGKVVWRHDPEATLDGRHITRWPSFIDPAFLARRKTW